MMDLHPSGLDQRIQEHHWRIEETNRNGWLRPSQGGVEHERRRALNTVGVVVRRRLPMSRIMHTATALACGRRASVTGERVPGVL